MKYCSQCGNACDDADLICKACGALLSAAPKDQGEQRQEGQSTGNGYADDGRGGYGYPTGNNTGNTPGANGTPGYYGRPPQNDGLAIASLVLGIVGIVTVWCCIGIVPSILAVIFGFISKSTSNRAGAVSGSAMSTAGIVLGIIACAVFTIYILYRIFWSAAVGNAIFNGVFDNTDLFRSGSSFDA